jgi:hypothetical protein
MAEKDCRPRCPIGVLEGSGVGVDVQAVTARVARWPELLPRELPQQRSHAAETRQRRLTLIRRVAVATWVVAILYWTLTAGVAFNRELVLVYIATGLVAASIGRRKMLMVVRDWLPFAVVLLVYDVSRGAATLVGTPTLWQWQVHADRWLFLGNMPTVWLQERLKLADPPWWEVAISTVYMSFFVLPYAVAGVLWLRDRADWKAFVRRFVTLSFTALAIYIVLPAAPPWAAARCTSDDIVGGPSYPTCMFDTPEGVPDGGLLGPMQSARPGANEFVERISTRGWETLHLHVARDLVNSGQVSVNMVAAIPSLHAALAAMVAAFLWRRVQRKWRPLLAAYVLMMAFTLVYSAEHYVIDILLGWTLAAAVLVAVGRFEGRRGITIGVMAQPLTVEQSREIPVDVQQAFNGTLPLPLPTLFWRWYGPIPPISKVSNQTGDWDAVGQTRTVMLTGGGSMREELTRLDAPHAFGYLLSKIKGPLSPLVSRVDGEWLFAPAGNGTTVTWRWRIHPRSRLAAPVLPVFGWLWRGYARQALEELRTLLTRAGHH